ncbi:Putative glutathione-dependent formaldehyde-activating enzyme [Pseudoalteromonas holothuriae]|uniref:Glutathione-dependent formaldehyde-activating enzyme n=1 Tax=Pseudoalteromonas holothuriae TaxID=2963714 RepID=A0A9W4VS47_9GAMM|nr:MULTISPECIES: GFA family protein [unclassified Pseudoalteromonas]CAH9051598.1 Putative glutathione-dependent formaldehyde-activating enzyme [Pseudoalteromonas sp. CIP111854]CAH9057091.1 Putative glutathione-dependent formaldehyde-activating enzyme [Pseudoalteromonas sp. CIP111951]
MYQASCLCGKVQIQIDGAISDIIHCHCSLCRKSSGTAFATNGFVNTDELHIVSGQEYIKFFEFKLGRKRHFCAHCASPLFSSNSDLPDKLRLRLGILDSNINERPMSHNFVTSQANWEDLDAGLPRYETFEPSRMK